MKPALPRTVTLAFWIPLLALPIGLALGSAAALRAPAPTGALETDETDTQQAVTPTPRYYMPLITPVTVVLSEGRGRVKITLGLALDPSGGRTMMARLAPRIEGLRADLVATVLDHAATLPSDQPPEAMRAELPQLLRTTLNDRLVELGEDPVILEVMITEWAIAR